MSTPVPADGLKCEARWYSLTFPFPHTGSHMMGRNVAVAAMLLAVVFAADASCGHAQDRRDKAPFQIIETTIDDIHSAFKSGRLTARQLVQGYLDRIAAYDKQGPNINSIITLNDQALEDADRLDAATGFSA